MKTRWMIVTLGLAMLLTVQVDSSAAKEEGRQEGIQSHLPGLRQAGDRGRRSSKLKDGKQGLLLLRELPEGVREGPGKVRA